MHLNKKQKFILGLMLTAVVTPTKAMDELMNQAFLSKVILKKEVAIEDVPSLMSNLPVVNAATNENITARELKIAIDTALPGEQPLQIINKASGGNVVPHLLHLGLGDTPQNRVAGKYVFTTLGIDAATTADQINGAAAFIAGHHANPTLPEIDGWVNNVGTRAARVLVGAAGLDATDAALINATARAVVVGAATDANGIADANYAFTTLAQGGGTTKDQIDGVAAFRVGGDAAPTLLEVNGWVGDVGTRAARVLVAAAALDATDADLIAAATRCGVVGIANPTADQINGAAAFIAGHHANPTQAEIDGWAGDVAAGRAARVLVGAAGLDATDAGLIAATARAVVVGTATDANGIADANYAFTTLAQGGGTTKDQIDGVAAFRVGGDAAPTLPEIDGWVNNVGTRAARVLVGAAGLDATDAGLIAATTRCTVVAIPNPTAKQIQGAASLIGKGNPAPNKKQINAEALLV